MKRVLGQDKKRRETMDRLKLAFKVYIIVITSLVAIYIKKSKSHLTPTKKATKSKRANHTNNNRKETPFKIVSKTTVKRNNIHDTPKKKGKPRTKIKHATGQTQRRNKTM